MLIQLAQNENLLRIDFLTPTRLTQDKHLVQHPLFLPLVKQTTLRVLDLAAQHGGGRPDFVLRNQLYPVAEVVRLVENRTHWWDERLFRAFATGANVGWVDGQRHLSV